jgi:hypothetical protein
MKMQIPLRHILAAVGTVISVAGLGCDQGPVDYGKFERRTIEENLTAIDSASSIYATLLAAGDIDSACAQAQAFLLTQPGVDSSYITSDSTVWAFFSSGLLAGTGDIRRDTTGSGAAGPEREPTVRVSEGGETGDYTHYALPHHTELPGTQKETDALRGIFKRKLDWDNDEVYKGSEVDIGMALGLVKMGGGVLLWAGHGALSPPGPFGEVPGLVLGKTYAKKAMAEAAVTELLGYLGPHPSLPHQAAVLKFVGNPAYHILLLPGFFRVNADFDQSESLPINRTKTIVYLSCCYSLYARSGFTSPLAEELYNKGADLVCGYTWAVGDGFACDRDTTFFKALADTCLPWEAARAMGNLTDPEPGRGGLHAELTAYGDSLVMLRALCRVKRDDDTLWAQLVQATRSISGSGISALLYPEPSSDPAANVMISFPGDQPGLFNCTADENATIYWTAAGTGRTYVVMKNYVGVSGTIDVKSCQPDAIIGHFEGKLGWWDFGKDPEKEPPSDTITLDAGVFKFTGKVGSGKLSPQRLVAGTPPTVR